MLNEKKIVYQTYRSVPLKEASRNEKGRRIRRLKQRMRRLLPTKSLILLLFAWHIGIYLRMLLSYVVELIYYGSIHYNLNFTLQGT